VNERTTFKNLNFMRNYGQLIYRAYGLEVEEYNKITEFLEEFKVTEPSCYILIISIFSEYLKEVDQQCIEEDIVGLSCEERKIHNLNRLTNLLSKVKNRMNRK
jgi:hypothetical protein